MSFKPMDLSTLYNALDCRSQSADGKPSTGFVMVFLVDLSAEVSMGSSTLTTFSLDVRWGGTLLPNGICGLSVTPVSFTAPSAGLQSGTASVLLGLTLTHASLGSGLVNSDCSGSPSADSSAGGWFVLPSCGRESGSQFTPSRARSCCSRCLASATIS